MLVPLLLLFSLGVIVIGSAWLLMQSVYTPEPTSYKPLTELDQRYLEAVHWSGYKGSKEEFRREHGEELGV